jgi:hypothetical protein
MSTLSLRLPDSVHKKIKEFAKREGISINQFIASAVTEKVSAFATIEYLRQRANHANAKNFRSALSNIPDVKPEEFDRL